MNKQEPRLEAGNLGLIYNQNTINVVVLACLVIMASVVLTGTMSYFVTRDAALDKLKTKDMVNIIDAVDSKIAGRIERAKETSLLLARDPAVAAWILSSEKDEMHGKIAKARLEEIYRNYDYANAFIVSAVTNQYWAEGARMIQVMSPTDPMASWFFSSLKLHKEVLLNIDYNSARQNTFIFVNALVGDVNKPIGIAGVGLSIKEFAAEFQRYKYSRNSVIWLVDEKGKIHLADEVAQNGMYLNDYMPPEVAAAIIDDKEATVKNARTIDYEDAQGKVFDLAYQKMQGTDWKLVVRVPREESLTVLNSIKWNTMVASLITLALSIFVFYFVSRKIANPLKQALLLNQEMERLVLTRTSELSLQNERIMDSISYAKRLQEAILPASSELDATFKEHFVIWKPRDIVGGDFYWSRRVNSHKSLIALCDCTGHGVPGAFMTMAVNTLLNHIVAQGVHNPSEVLAKLNREFKATLHRQQQTDITDDGLDIGICLIEGRRITFAGAKIVLYRLRDGQICAVKGDRKSIGYRRAKEDLQFTTHELMAQEEDRFYLATDGYTDQNGEENEYPFGRKRLITSLEACATMPMEGQKQWLTQCLKEYQGRESQRDDITLLGFSLR
ncbi:SpoIIE family protein phosphatase [Anaeroarcus burkinensis]|uniref:SpoIIE family protein phosphatase n=1 Tax=Anaeroarcus burkinensis TaxID=82376 RepID=UPI0004297396|nr:SpoIIE family protein phosphatase [Anaeroarcus burkinensis]